MNNNQSNELEEIKARIKAHQAKSNTSTSISNYNSNPFNIAVEIVAGVVAGLVVGIFLDKLFTSKPIFLIVCLIISNIASGRSIWQKFNNIKK